MSIPRRIREVRGLTSDDALLALADMAAQVPAGRVIVELGVYMGKTALALAWGASQGGGAHVYAVDPWELAPEASEHPVDPRYRKWPTFNSPGARRWAEWNVRALGYSSKVSLVHGFSAEVGKSYSGAPVGLLFVDGDHAYDAVRNDVAAWEPHLTTDSVIVFDDYESSHEGSTVRAIDDMVHEGYLEPIQLFHGRLAVTKLTAKHKAEMDDARALLASLPDQSCSPTAITSEGVEPAPATTEGQPEPAEHPAAGILDQYASREFVQEDELLDVPAGTAIGELKLDQLKALAKTRRITLGARKDKKDLILDALRRGE